MVQIVGVLNNSRFKLWAWRMILLKNKGHVDWFYRNIIAVILRNNTPWNISPFWNEQTAVNAWKNRIIDSSVSEPGSFRTHIAAYYFNGRIHLSSIEMERKRGLPRRSPGWVTFNRLSWTESKHRALVYWTAERCIVNLSGRMQRCLSASSGSISRLQQQQPETIAASAIVPSWIWQDGVGIL